MTNRWDSIEGEAPIDPSDLKIKSLKTRSELSPYEAENIRKATVKYLAAEPNKRLAPFTYEWMLQLHREMFGEVWEWAGKARTRNLSLGIESQMIGQEFGSLVLDIASFSTDENDLLDQAVLIHHKAVQIHPFENGNGRWSRMLANIWLRQHGKSVIEWPDVEIGEQASSIRKDYIEAIQLADSFDYGPLTELHRRYWPDA